MIFPWTSLFTSGISKDTRPGKMTLKQFASWHGRGGVETALTEHHRNSARTHHAGTRFGRSSAEFDSTNAAGSSHSGPETTTGRASSSSRSPNSRNTTWPRRNRWKKTMKKAWWIFPSLFVNVYQRINHGFFVTKSIPICSMYGIFINICPKNHPVL